MGIVATVQEYFPDFHLEGKVELLGGSIVRKSPIMKVYARQNTGECRGIGRGLVFC